LLLERIGFSPTFTIERDRDREKIRVEEKNKRKGLEARARRGIHHLGAKLKLELEILGARGKRVRFQP
jgi:hypothetical protein